MDFNGKLRAYNKAINAVEVKRERAAKLVGVLEAQLAKAEAEKYKAEDLYMELCCKVDDLSEEAGRNIYHCDNCHGYAAWVSSVKEGRFYALCADCQESEAVA